LLEALCISRDSAIDGSFPFWAKVTAGFDPIMPTFQGRITEEGLLQMIAYIKSLGERPRPESK